MADMPGRARTNWVGVVLEAPDPQALADFYSAVLGWPVAQRDEHGPGTRSACTSTNSRSLRQAAFLWGDGGDRRFSGECRG